jgi:hypothetical protein
MNDHRVDDLLRGSVPSESSEARERARIRLRRAIAQESAASAPRRHRRPLVALVAAVIVAVVSAIVLQITLPPGSGGPGRSAADEIHELGRLSTGQQPLRLGPDDYIYSHILEFRPQSVEGQGGEYILAIKADVESWYAKDGSGGRETTYQEVEFVSPLDRDNWVEAGSPSLPEVGTTDTERFSPGELAIFAMEGLPTDPDNLRTALQNDVVIATGEGDVSMLSSIGSLLGQENLSAELRQALFDVAATIPSVTVRHGVVDDVGRPAVSVTATDASGDTTLFFDQEDARLLGSSGDHPPAEGHPPFTEWRVYLDSSLVSDIGQRPPN